MTKMLPTCAPASRRRPRDQGAPASVDRVDEGVRKFTAIDGHRQSGFRSREAYPGPTGDHPAAAADASIAPASIASANTSTRHRPSASVRPALYTRRPDTVGYGTSPLSHRQQTSVERRDTAIDIYQVVREQWWTSADIKTPASGTGGIRTPGPCGPPAFKAGAFVRSATVPAIEASEPLHALMSAEQTNSGPLGRHASRLERCHRVTVDRWTTTSTR